MNFTKEAELQRFFEKDIIEFLDRKKVMSGSNDLLKEFKKELELRNYPQAANILESAIERFNQTNSNDVYREIYFNEILELVRFANQNINKESKNRLTQDLQMLEKSRQLDQEPTLNITVFEERKKKEKEKKYDREEKIRQNANKIENEMIEINKRLLIHIRKKDLQNAMNLYKELKSKFEQYPSSLIDEKTELYNDMIAFFMRIKKLKEEIKAEKIQATKIQKPHPPERILKIEEIKKIVDEVKKNIKDSEFREAKTKIIHLKHTISLIPEKYINIKKKLDDIANTLMQKTEFAKNLHHHDNIQKEGLYEN